MKNALLVHPTKREDLLSNTVDSYIESLGSLEFDQGEVSELISFLLQDGGPISQSEKQRIGQAAVDIQQSQGTSSAQRRYSTSGQTQLSRILLAIYVVANISLFERKRSKQTKTHCGISCPHWLSEP